MPNRGQLPAGLSSPTVIPAEALGRSLSIRRGVDVLPLFSSYPRRPSPTSSVSIRGVRFLPPKVLSRPPDARKRKISEA